MSDAADHWRLHAAQWDLVGPPLRPGPDDVARAAAAVGAWAAAARRAPRVVVLGVTPELVQMAWPRGTSLVAVDRSPHMIDAVFPRAGGPPDARGVRGEWLALPLLDGACDLVLGDGCLTLLGYPADYRALAAELRRVLAPGARFVLRVFAAPVPAEPLAEVAAALWGARIASFHAFKWRLAMAIQPASRNVRVSDIARAFDELVPDRAALAARTGWRPDTIATIDVYRGSPAVYSFPSLDEVRAALAGDFVELACDAPAYELGERCPTLVWQLR